MWVIRVDSIVKKNLAGEKEPELNTSRKHNFVRDRSWSTHPGKGSKSAYAPILGGVNIYAGCHSVNRRVPALEFGKLETFGTKCPWPQVTVPEIIHKRASSCRGIGRTQGCHRTTST